MGSRMGSVIQNDKASIKKLQIETKNIAYNNKNGNLPGHIYDDGRVNFRNDQQSRGYNNIS